MRTLARAFLLLASAVWLASSSDAQTVTNSVNILFNFSDFQQVAANVSQVKIIPIPTNGAVNGRLLHQEFPNYTRATTPSLTNGTLTVSNMLKGVVYETTFTARGRDQTYYVNADTNAADGATIGAWTNVVAPTNLFGLFLSYVPKVSGATIGQVWTATDDKGGGSWQDSQGNGGGISLTTASNIVKSGSGVIQTNPLVAGISYQFTAAATNIFDARATIAATAATNGYPWGALYDALNAALNATNAIGLSSGLAAFRPTNSFASSNVATTARAGVVKPDGSTITVTADGTISSATGGSGDFTGPASSTADNFVSFNNTSGKVGKDSGKNSASFDISGAATAATNGFPWGVLYDPVGAALAATNSLYGTLNTAKADKATTLTINGTANQITSSAGAQDLNANRTVTLSIPNTWIAPGSVTATTSITNGGVYYGNGSGLSNLDATQLIGTVPLASLPGSVVTNTGPNTITGDLTVIGTATATSVKVTSATASTMPVYDAGKNLVSIANPGVAGTYVPTNNGLGGFGWAPAVNGSLLKSNAVAVTDGSTNLASVVNVAGVLQNNGDGTAIGFTNKPTLDLGSSTNHQWPQLVLAAASNATNYTLDVAAYARQEIITANTNINITFANIATNRMIDLYVNAVTSTVPCIITLPAHVIQNHFISLTVTNGQAGNYHFDFWNGTDPTNAVITGGDYYQRT